MSRGGEATTPRLLTLDEAAVYMALPLATVRHLGIGRIRLGTKTRYDRFAINAYLDERAGLAATMPAHEADTDEAALERIYERERRASGRP